MSCPKCEAFFGDWRSQGPWFPDGDWEIVEKEDIEVGTHAAVTVMQGTAKCRSCGQLASFGCSYGPGYYFSPNA